MTKTPVHAAQIKAPLAIAPIQLLPTQRQAAAAPALQHIGRWEWQKLAGIEHTHARTLLLVQNQ
ncbi:phosphatidate cytidylyltransferase, partial [Stenotrophomonas maltophilia]